MDQQDQNGLTMAGRIELVRRLLDYTRKQWAEELGVSTRIIENIEYGKQRPTSEIFEAISKKFPFILNYVVSGDSEVVFTNEEKKFLKDLEKYDASEVKEILNSKPKKRY
ncbi:hypothetical protein EOPP23_06760 [Endozoicomonas sp. OPT23]|uniref:helix-turn-helix domain-containing protein n=1 Tax=Endozoicomonas sp. OPT23 TaxID=2072845 RepID=UPI00129A66ED|nr:helix-turn-helix transcriptional regulator [Endozoicomonas sp. OPT23]MRI32686.1 hypothetical protein [Endozoicomonas sp. OPT23]